MEDLSGRTIGQYRLIEQIGRGGMATVYRGYQSALNRYVAVKVLPTLLTEQEDFLGRFRQEATAVANLRHPNILAVYDFGQESEFAYIVMEFVQGGTLKNRLGQPMNPSLACRVIAQIARALDYAHRQGVVHRDVKPANILMPTDDWALLSDFGIAKIVQAPVAYTQPGTSIGTPEYMSPEQAQGLPVDGRSDIYSLGVVLFEMLTGQAPFKADTPLSVVIKHVTEAVPPPRSLAPHIPESLERIVLKAMAKRPEDRYQVAGDLAAALDAAAEPTVLVQQNAPPVGQPTIAEPVPPRPQPAPPRKGSSSGLFLAIGAGVAIFLFLGCVGGLAGLYILGSNSSTPTPTNAAIALATRTAPVASTSTVAPASPAAATRTQPPAASPTRPLPTVGPAGTSSAGTATPRPRRPLPMPAALSVQKGQVLLNETFASNDNQWDENATDAATRFLKDGQYHIVINLVDWVGWSNPGKDYSFGDFVLEADATEADGPDDNAYGILFRYVDSDNFYRFDITGDGLLRLQKKEGGEYTSIADWTSSKAIKTGKQTNKIGIVAKGNTFNFYVNDVYVGGDTDASFTTGSIGLIAAAYKEGGPGVDIAFDNLKVWEAK